MSRVVTSIRDPAGKYVYLFTSSQASLDNYNYVPTRISRYNLNDWTLDSSLDLSFDLDGALAVIGNIILLSSII